jgi:uncharacterized membrane protein
MTMTIERHVDVHAEVGDAYARWWRSFESGDISDDVEVVEPAGPEQYRWRASVAGIGEEWIAEVTERIPGRRIAWTSRAGAPNAGCVTFHRLDDAKTRVMLQLEFQPEGVVEKIGAWLGFVDRRVDTALNDFKIHLETEGGLSNDDRAGVARHA